MRSIRWCALAALALTFVFSHAARAADAPLTAAGFHEPSLVFLHGTRTLLTDGPAAADFLLATPGAWAAIEASAEEGFQARLSAAGHQAEKQGEADGFNYSRGRPAHITLWKLAP